MFVISERDFKKVFQTDFGRGTGNCLQACVASICGVELEHVPHFVTFENWTEEYVRYLASHHLVVMWNYVINDQMLARFLDRIRYEGLCILSVESFNLPGCLHAVVGKIERGTINVVHDPNPAYADKDQSEYRVAQIDLFY
jgi:hypothetical protein